MHLTQGPQQLRVEHLDCPLGTTERFPRLSWWLPAGSANQLAYRIQAGEWAPRSVSTSIHHSIPRGPLLLVATPRLDNLHISAAVP